MHCFALFPHAHNQRVLVIATYVIILHVSMQFCKTELINILFLISWPILHFQDFEKILQSLRGCGFACVLTGAESRWISVKNVKLCQVQDNYDHSTSREEVTQMWLAQRFQPLCFAHRRLWTLGFFMGVRISGIVEFLLDDRGVIKGS